MIPTMVNIFQAALGTLVDARLANAWGTRSLRGGNTTSDSRSEVNDVYVYLIHVEINVELHTYVYIYICIYIYTPYIYAYTHTHHQ